MKKILLSLFILFSITIHAQEQKVELRNFKGLNTVDGDFTIKPNEARDCLDIDFSNVGSITKRLGYDSVSVISGMDSIIAIYGAYYSDGTQQLFVVADSNGTGYGAVYVTSKGSVNLDSLTKISGYWPVFGTPRFTMFGDDVYIVNGYGRGIIYSDGVTRSYPPKAPGEAIITPIDDSGDLNGEYLYIISIKQDTTADDNPFDYSYNDTIYQGVISDRVRVKNGQVLLTGFSFPVADSTHTIWDTSGSGTGVTFVISRTKVNPGRITPELEFFTINTFYAEDAEKAYNTIIVDNRSDSAISALSFPRYSYPKFDVERKGRLANGSLEYRYGAPGFYSQDNNASPGLYDGVPDQPDTLGFAYACTYIDTITGIESDTGRSLFVFADSDSLQRAISLQCPKTPFSETGLVKNIYRSIVRSITYVDSFYFEGGTVIGTEIKIGGFWISRDVVDTVVVNEYRLLGQIASSDTLFIDSVLYSEAITRRAYKKATPPDILNDIFTAQGRLFGLKGSRLYRSGLLNSLDDTLQTWGQMDFQSMNESDGDVGITSYPTRTAIRFMKNFSNFNIYSDFSKVELSGTIGCIAPQSHSAGISGHYYLSDAGVVFETEGQQLERTYNTPLISNKLDNFEKLSITEKSKATSFYIDRKYMLNIGDTTYVYDEHGGDWSIWRFNFLSATLYGAENSVDFIPGDTMYFVRPGDSVLYRYGTSETDNGSAIQIAYKTPPLFIDNSYKQATAIGLWATSSDVNDSIIVQILDEEGSTVGQMGFPTLTQRYYEKGHKTSIAKYLQFIIATDISTSLNTTVIDGLDIYYKYDGKTLRE